MIQLYLLCSYMSYVVYSQFYLQPLKIQFSGKLLSPSIPIEGPTTSRL